MAKTSSWIPHIEAFVDSTRPPNQQNASLDAIVSLVKNDLLTIETLVKEMGLYLTTTDNVIRARGILLLADLLTCLATKPLDHATIHSLIGFFTERLADWQALHGALVGCLALLRRKSTAGVVIDSDAKALVQSYLQNIQVQSLAKDDRKLCFEMLECLLDRYPATVATLGDDLIYGICEAIDGEKDPECLMVMFHLVEVLAQLFPDPSGPLAGFAEEVFDVLGRYFPIHFTHPINNEYGVKRDDLSRALMLAFSSTPLFEPFAIPLLLEKLSSSLPAAKVDSLKYLSNCLVKYGADKVEKHAKAIWSSLKDAICTSSSQDPIFSIVSQKQDGIGFQENEIAKEALVCLQKFILQDDVLVLSLILGDEEIETILSSVTSIKRYNDIPKESKQKLHAVGCMLSISAKVSTPCCNKVFQKFFCRLMDILGISTESSSRGISDGTHELSEELNFGALYLCIELLDACRCSVMGSKEHSPQPVSAEETWCCLITDFSGPLTGALHYILGTSMNGNTSEADIHCGVKGLQILATFPGGSLPISKSIFESILTIFVSVISDSREDTLLWRLTLNALKEVGIFIDELHDSEKVLSFMTIVVEKVISLISLSESSMPLPLRLEAISVVGAAGQNFMLRAIQVLEEAISENFFYASVDGNLKSAEILVPLLECYSNKVLPWFHNSGDFEDVAFRFAVSIWNQVESNKTFNIGVQRKELLGEMMTAMRLAVAGCSEDIQGLIVQKAYSVLASSTFFPLKDVFSVPAKLEELQLTKVVDSLSCRDEWLISLFASVIIALRPRTPLVNVRVILKLFTIVLLKGHVPAAQALGSITNKLPLNINSVEVSSACTLEEAMDVIFNMGLQSASDSGPSRKGSAMDGGDVGLIDFCLNVGNSSLTQTNAVVGLAWIGKGLLMRGHEKLKDVVMILLRCLLLTGSVSPLPLQQDMLGECKEQDMHPTVIRSAADAFDVLLSDSNVCLNKRFHATIKPLYKQHFFYTMMPILLSSIKDSDSSTTRSMLYRAFGHVISNTPLAAVVTEAKRVIFALLDALPMLSLDVRDKDLTYSLLLVLSGIIMDESGREAVTENAHIIINRLIGLISYRQMMLVRETAIQCLVAVSGLPHTRIYPMRTQVLQAISKALDDPKRIVRQEAGRCRQAWVSIASGSTGANIRYCQGSSSFLNGTARPGLNQDYNSETSL
ncbi:RNAPII transcription regulator C-terminal [Macleaya cordata]|uniref:MMS19 nucleotide excision repair protein n=1 Tax=Macleaya cordata TaxID=56857 RepID=A0A200QDH6_MACCD|nr:RNAPII transcription regulator C-terminal [Macleaya cordata]